MKKQLLKPLYHIVSLGVYGGTNTKLFDKTMMIDDLRHNQTIPIINKSVEA